MSSERKPPIGRGDTQAREGGQAKEGAPPREEESFLDRWSRRKATARKGEAPEDLDSVPTDATGASPAESAVAEGGESAPEIDEAALTEAELAQRYALPDPASLDKGSDYSVFMREGVPDRLRTSALRQLWRNSPDIGCIDGLVEYGEDFSISGAAVQTAYEVGKGFAKRIEAWEQEQEEKARAEKEQAERAALEEKRDGIDKPGEVDRESSPAGVEPSEPQGPSEEVEAVFTEAPSEPVSLTRRRMKFHFHGPETS